MTAASNSEARKRATPPADPVEVVARALFRRQLEIGVAVPSYSSPDAERIVAALRVNGFAL